MSSLAHDDPVGWKRQLELWGLNRPTHWAVAGVAPKAVQRLSDWLARRDATVAAVTNEVVLGGRSGLTTAVLHPTRIGVDRLLSVLAAYRRTPPGTSAVVLSVGTAMTIDFLRPGGRHVGGAILPGPVLMARSLHEYTAKLPVIEIDPVLPVRVWGATTEEAIDLGIASAVLGAADQLVWDWAALSAVPPWVFATGGDAGYFRGFVFTADVGGFVIDPLLTLDGIRLVAEELP
jgi:type III pantothenate kinase